ncbi:U3 small nucleolar RNA-associated protein 6 protein [Besnoitia besnoiti]|uniref:U3 small nucleolar RNA-associated protein 6 protein n=1 Tax=Besnoitia besnoiti TaxID=94643 RepID=A0A2A9MBF6_BESBE|nr:U3 small nucleolar RNA-associated protein 6 protein [Besnoitia besnoiti]PFH32722.1 U3 small nucleolar RNA-associated protein 6 protein [Besnoitia besnoiti]
MADGVQWRLEEGLNELDALVSRQLLEEDEAREVLRRRRDFEFACSGRGDPSDAVQQFLLYIQYEANLLSLLRHRCSTSLHTVLKDLEDVRRAILRLTRDEAREQRGGADRKRQMAASGADASSLSVLLKRRKREESNKARRAENVKNTLHAVMRSGTNRLYSLITRLLHCQSSSLPLWLSCADLLLQLGASRLLQTFLLQAIRRFPRCSPLWILSADRLLQQGNLHGARLLLLQGLRVEKASLPLWSGLLRLEGVALGKAAQGILRAREKRREREKNSRAGESAAEAEDGAGADCVAVRKRREEDSIVLVEETEKLEKLKARGQALIVVLRGGLKKLGGGLEAESATASEQKRRKIAHATSASSQARRPGKEDEISRKSNMCLFLLRALGLCLHLQASKAADVLTDAVSAFQSELADLLHAAAEDHCLLRLYEFKVCLLRAASEGAEGTRRVQNVLQDIFAECCVEPRLLLLVAFHLRALRLAGASSVVLAAPRGDNGVFADEAASRECLADDIEICFDLEGADEPAETPLPGTEEPLGEAAETATAGKGDDAREAAAVAEEGPPPMALETASSAAALAAEAPLKLQKGDDLEKCLFSDATREASNDIQRSLAAARAGAARAGEPEAAPRGCLFNREAKEMLDLLADCGQPDIRHILKEEPRLAAALLLHHPTGGDEESETAQQAGGAEKTTQSMTALLTADHFAETQKVVLWNALWRETNAGHRLWLLRCIYTAAQQLVGAQTGAAGDEEAQLHSAAVSATGEILQALLREEKNSASASDSLVQLDELEQEVNALLRSAFKKWPCVPLLLLSHHRMQPCAAEDRDGMSLSGASSALTHASAASSRFIPAARSLLRRLTAGPAKGHLRAPEGRRLLWALLGEEGVCAGEEAAERSRGDEKRRSALPEWMVELLLAARPETTSALAHDFLRFLEQKEEDTEEPQTKATTPRARSGGKDSSKQAPCRGRAARAASSGPPLLALSEAQAVFECALRIFERCGVVGGCRESADAFEPKRKLVPEARRGERLEQQGKPLVRQVLQVVPHVLELHRLWWINFWRFARFQEAFRASRSSLPILVLAGARESKSKKKTADGVARGGAACLAGRALATSPLLNLQTEGTGKAQRDSATASALAAGASQLRSEDVERRARLALGARESSWLAEDSCVPGPEGRGCRTCEPGRLWCMYTADAGGKESD